MIDFICMTQHNRETNMLSRRFFLSVFAGTLVSTVAKARPQDKIFYKDDEIVVVNGWVLTHEEMKKGLHHAL